MTVATGGITGDRGLTGGDGKSSLMKGCLSCGARWGHKLFKTNQNSHRVCFVDLDSQSPRTLWFQPRPARHSLLRSASSGPTKQTFFLELKVSRRHIIWPDVMIPHMKEAFGSTSGPSISFSAPTQDSRRGPQSLTLGVRFSQSLWKTGTLPTFSSKHYVRNGSSQ